VGSADSAWREIERRAQLRAALAPHPTPCKAPTAWIGLLKIPSQLYGNNRHLIIDNLHNFHRN
jgi:hypothetical protein